MHITSRNFLGDVDMSYIFEDLPLSIGSTPPGPASKNQCFLF